ncbi:MAG: YkvA family protein, partial [Xanthomonadales bacterium]|nr:YkvA family protein [Xanthomonadales bacterium]
METSQIDALIAEHCGDEQAIRDLHELLSVVAERRGASPGHEALDRGAEFVLRYIQQVPYMLKVAATAAANVGLESEMEHILGMVRSYWAQDLDVIPDHLGVIGLLDDAYCSLTSLQAVS